MGLPIKVPLIDIHTVGGQVVGLLLYLIQVVLYELAQKVLGQYRDQYVMVRGGVDITVTDANLFLGRISAKHFLNGKMSLSTDKTINMIEDFSDRIGISAIKATEGILQIANSTMVSAIKVISVERGFDCRDFTLVSYGGAGGLHAAFLAENLGIQTILIPPNGGLLSAYGMLYANVIKDYSQTILLQIKSKKCR